MRFDNHYISESKGWAYGLWVCLSVQWLLAGHPVCREAFAHLLGVGKRRLTRCRRSYQGRDLRTVGGRGRTFDKTLGLSFLIFGGEHVLADWIYFLERVYKFCGSTNSPALSPAASQDHQLHLQSSQQVSRVFWSIFIGVLQSQCLLRTWALYVYMRGCLYVN